MGDCPSKLELHYRPVKRHLRDQEGCCERCTHRATMTIHNAVGDPRGREDRCAPIVGNNAPDHRRYRIRLDHVCDAFGGR